MRCIWELAFGAAFAYELHACMRLVYLYENHYALLNQRSVNLSVCFILLLITVSVCVDISVTKTPSASLPRDETFVLFSSGTAFLISASSLI